MDRVLALLVFFASIQGFAITPEEMLTSPNSPYVVPHVINDDSTYRIGDEWGKTPLTTKDKSTNDIYLRMALATAKIRGGATGFYIGEFNGEYLVATNHHVCPSSWSCSGSNAIRFEELGISAHVSKFYGSWPEIDLAIFSISLKDAKVIAKLNSVASPFAFNEHLRRGQKLATIGFGSAKNPRHELMGNRDSDCIVFSGDGEYRLMGDPDDLNPGSYDAWSFSNGCDVSHGDSGSAMMDRETGRVIGIIWTGRIPKNRNVQSSSYLTTLLANPTEEVWKELSYGVPAIQMKGYLLEKLAKGEFSGNDRKTIEAMLN